MKTRKFWKKYKFHCSALPLLMTKSRNKSDILSETAKLYLRDLWIKETYGREKFDSTNKFTEKGLQVEQDSLELVTNVLQKGFLAKNKELLANEYVCGTPDVIKPILIDIKSSWDIWTFAGTNKRKAEKDYYWQLFGYMWLLGKKRSKLIYALVNTPDEIVADEIYRLHFKIGEDKAQSAKINYCFDDIPTKKRVKVFNLKFNSEKVQEVINILDEARNYLSQIKL